jgi:hypothetical protein
MNVQSGKRKVRNGNPEPDLISEDDMRAIIRTAIDEAGGLNAMCRRFRIRSPGPIYLAMQEERAISDGIATHFGFELQRCYRRIGHVTQTSDA